jgi:glucose/arabinose dehydrogenase
MAAKPQLALAALTLLAAASPSIWADGPPAQPTITGTAAFEDYSQQSPGVRRKITAADLPAPYATTSVDNGPSLVPKPADAWPKAPAGFKVELYATGLDEPRLTRFAPNGDLFVADSEVDRKPDTGKIRVFRGVDANGKPQQVGIYASGLAQPFGIAFYPLGPNPQWLYIGNTDSVIRFPYKSGDLKASGPAQKITDLPGGGRLRGGGHWTRDIVFSPDGKLMFVSVGSHSNVDDPDTHPEEFHRADVLEFTPEGKFIKVYASGIRNCVGEAIQPETGELWCSTNERDALGDNLVPDYITSVKEGGFYGWPWYYIGSNQDPRQAGKHPELKGKVIVPDVLLQPHFASLEMLFYEGSEFPAQYKGDIFAAEHGSWNKSKRAGYEVIRVPVKDGKATGEYEDFLTGFVTSNGNVWGRPVGVAVAPDGSLFVTDDGYRAIWHVIYTGGSASSGGQ